RVLRLREMVEPLVSLYRLLDGANDRLRFLHPAVRHQPAWTFGDHPPNEHDADPEDCAQSEAEPPAEGLGNQPRGEQGAGEEGTGGGAHPPTPVDRQIRLPARTGRD